MSAKSMQTGYMPHNSRTLSVREMLMTSPALSLKAGAGPVHTPVRDGSPDRSRMGTGLRHGHSSMGSLVAAELTHGESVSRKSNRSLYTNTNAARGEGKPTSILQASRHQSSRRHSPSRGPAILKSDTGDSWERAREQMRQIASDSNDKDRVPGVTAEMLKARNSNLVLYVNVSTTPPPRDRSSSSLGLDRPPSEHSSSGDTFSPINSPSSSFHHHTPDISPRPPPESQVIRGSRHTKLPSPLILQTPVTEAVHNSDPSQSQTPAVIANSPLTLQTMAASDGHSEADPAVYSVGASSSEDTNLTNSGPTSRPVSTDTWSAKGLRRSRDLVYNQSTLEPVVEGVVSYPKGQNSDSPPLPEESNPPSSKSTVQRFTLGALQALTLGRYSNPSSPVAAPSTPTASNQNRDGLFSLAPPPESSPRAQSSSRSNDDINAKATAVPITNSTRPRPKIFGASPLSKKSGDAGAGGGGKSFFSAVLSTLRPGGGSSSGGSSSKDAVDSPSPPANATCLQPPVSGSNSDAPEPNSPFTHLTESNIPSDSDSPSELGTLSPMRVTPASPGNGSPLMKRGVSVSFSDDEMHPPLLHTIAEERPSLLYCSSNSSVKAALFDSTHSPMLDPEARYTVFQADPDPLPASSKGLSGAVFDFKSASYESMLQIQTEHMQPVASLIPARVESVDEGARDRGRTISGSAASQFIGSEYLPSSIRSVAPPQQLLSLLYILKKYRMEPSDAALFSSLFTGDSPASSYSTNSPVPASPSAYYDSIIRPALAAVKESLGADKEAATASLPSASVFYEQFNSADTGEPVSRQHSYDTNSGSLTGQPMKEGHNYEGKVEIPATSQLRFNDSASELVTRGTVNTQAVALSVEKAAHRRRLSHVFQMLTAALLALDLETGGSATSELVTMCAACMAEELGEEPEN